MQDKRAMRPTSQIVGRTAAALDKAHEANIVHRDLKPGNILFDNYGDAYLSDFGIAKLLEGGPSLTGTGVIGTPQYMSPEQAKGQGYIDGRSDIYNLGAILFEMLSGQLPYHADTPVGMIMKHMSEPVPRVRALKPDLPQDVEKIIQRSMAKDRDQRYQTAGQLAADLNKLVSAKPGPISPATDETVIEAWDHQAAWASPAVPDPGQAAVADDATVLERYEPPAAPVEQASPPAASSSVPSKTPPTKPAKKRRRFPVWLLAVIAIAVIAMLIYAARFMLPDLLNPLANSSAANTAETTVVTTTGSYGSFDTLCSDIPAPTEAQVTLQFLNQSGLVAVGFWENRSQNPVAYVDYFRAADGDAYLQETQVGHNWVIQEPSGGTLIEYQASNVQTQCVLVSSPQGPLWIQFQNQSGAPVIGYLVDAAGAEEAQFISSNGAVTGLWSPEEAVWRVKDGSGNNLLEYTATTAAEQKVIILP